MYKLNIKKQIYPLIHLISLFFSFLISELYFFSAKGVDFSRYKVYLEYFQGDVSQTIQNQGLLYYYSNYLMMLVKQSSLTSLNNELFLNTSIQTTNILFYLCGVIGLFKLLKIYGYNSEGIYISLSVLHFVPKVIEMRVLMKPEIAAFAFLPWIIISCEKYFYNKEKKYLILATLPLSLLLTSKPSIAGMVGLFLLIKFYNKINLSLIKESWMILLLLLILCFGLGFENYSANEVHIFDTLNEEGGYLDNTASISFLFTINQEELYDSPEFGYHNNSLLGITFLDTFGDYYKVNLKSEDSYFTYYQRNPFSNFKDSNGFNYGKFSRNYLELTFALVFYIAIFLAFKRNKEISLFVISPLIGLFVLLLNAYGVIGKNFDPLTGDTMKTSYYAFFIAISFIFLLCELNKKFEILGKLFSIILILIFLFMLGFPKSDYKVINSNLNEKVVISSLCRPTSLLLDEVKGSDCSNVVKLTCEYNLLSINPKNIFEANVPYGFTILYRGDSPGGEIVPNEKVKEFINEGGYSLEPVLEKYGKKYLDSQNPILLQKEAMIVESTEIKECIKYISEGYEPINDISFHIKTFPFLNVVVGFLSLFSFFVINRSINKK